MTNRIDLKFGLDWQAYATLTLVEEMINWGSEPLSRVTGIRLQTFALHNGREHHAAIVVDVNHGRALMLSFGECRNSDSLMVWREYMDHAPFNQPTVSDLTDEGYDAREGFDCGDIMGAATYITNAMRAFVGVPE